MHGEANPHPDLPSSWHAALRFCPYCSGTGCEWCDGTGDLVGSWLAQAYTLGRDEGVRKMRDVYRVLVYAGRQVSAEAPPEDLKRRLTGRP